MGRKKSEKLLRHLEKEGFRVEKIVEDLPLRLYPFHGWLRRLGLLKKFAHIRHDLSMGEAIPFIFSGRAIKYLFLKR